MVATIEGVGKQMVLMDTVRELVKMKQTGQGMLCILVLFFNFLN